MKKILTVIGARPQFIKASVVSSAIDETRGLREIVVHTGQHYDENMSQVFFADLGMRKPNYHLGIGGGSHAEMTGRMLIEIEKVIKIERPEIVLVYGDTNSTLSAALAAAKLHVPVAHVEAGLRSFNLKMPEEINRILTDRISHWLFTPTKTASDNLKREGAPEKSVVLVGDVMYDVALHHGKRVGPDGRMLQKLGFTPKNYVLATVHRAENTENDLRLNYIIDSLRQLSRTIPVVWPLHPRTRNALKKRGNLESLLEGISFTEPVSYLEMVQLEKYASLVVTDSGGVQKEAFFYHVPCVTLRDETEWVELVEAGWNCLTPPVSSDSIFKNIQSAIGKTGKEIEPYGSGKAAQLVAFELAK